jgi:hypothetical protein
MRKGEVRVSSPGISRKFRKQRRERRHHHLLAPGVKAERRAQSGEDESTGQRGGRWRR